MASSFTLNGRIILEGGSAIKTAEAMANRTEKIAASARASTTALIENAKAMEIGSRAALNESKSLATLAVAQEKANAVRRNSLAAAAPQRARARAITSDAVNRTAIAEGQRQLVLNRALGETVKQRIAVEDAAGRAAVRGSQMAQAAARTQIQQDRLLLQQQRANAAEARSAAAAAKESLGTTRGAISSLGSATTRFGLVTGAMFVGFAANAVIMEREFANVIRTSDILDSGLSKIAQGHKIDALREQFDGLAQALPISYKELTQIGAAANQLGVSSGNLASFTKTVAQFSAVTGVSVDAASTAFGRLDSLIVNTGGHANGVNHNYRALADSINKVGVNSVATDQEIINLSSQIAGIANAAGLGYKDIIGFGGALASVKISPFLARGLTTRLFTDIGNAVSEGGNKLTQYAQVAGLSAQEFTKAWKNDPKTAIIDLFDGIRRSGGKAVDVLKSLGITSVLDQPSIIRLANAADKYGKSADFASRSGGILRQTFRDSYTAAGETARQYGVISNTISAKLQVALNRTQILFRNIAASNLGPLGKAVDDVSGSVLKLSQNLDKPFKLFGIFNNLPFFDKTNGEILGLGVTALGLVSIFTLLVGAGSKVVAAFLALRQAQQGVAGWLGRGAAAMEVETAAANELAAANTRAAASTRSFNNLGAAGAGRRAVSGLTPGYSRVVGGADSVARATAPITAGSSMFAARTGNLLTRPFIAMSGAVDRAANRMQNLNNSSNRVVRALAPIGSVGAASLGRVSSAAGKIGGALGSAARGVGNFLGGPLGIVTMGAVALGIIGSLRDGFRDLGSTASQASVGIAQAKTQTQVFAAVKTNQDSMLGTLLSGPKMGAFVKNAGEFRKGLSNLGGGGAVSDFVQQFATLGQERTNFESFTQGLDHMDKGIKQLADNGDNVTALKQLQTAFKGATGTEITNGMNHMSESMSLVVQRLTEMGLKTDAATVIKALKGQIKGFTDGATAADKALSNMTDAFNGDIPAATEYINAIKTASDASTDLNKAWQEAGKIKGGDPFGNFVKQTKKNLADYQHVQENALKIAADTGANLADLAALDPGLLAGAVKGGKKNEKQLADVMSLKDVQQKFNESIAAIGNNPRLNNLLQSLPAKLKKVVLDGLGKGMNLNDAFAKAGPKAIAAFNAAVKGSKIDPIKIPQPHKVTIVVGADALPARKIGQSAVAYLKSLKGTLKVDGNPAPAVRKGESARAYINRLHGKITIEGNNLPAIRKGESAKAYINRIHGKLTVDGNNAPAIHKGESAKAYLDRLRGTIKVDAATGAAEAAIARTARDRHTTIFVDESINKRLGRASGGIIYGAGTGTSDSIPINVSNGEYIVRASQTRKYKDLLDSINYGIQGYATGGMVKHYESTGAAQAGVYIRNSQNAQANAVMTELSPYDRHLLQQIADNIGVTIAPTHIASAQHTVNRTQSRRGNG